MSVKYFSIASLILGTCLVTVSLKNSIGNTNNLIPRDILFGNQERTGAQISPDGTQISYLANGQTPETSTVINVWIMPVEGSDARQITFDTGKGVRHYYWRYNSKELFYQQDADGDENWQLFGVSLDDLSVREYSPAGSLAYVVAYSKYHPDRMLIALNEENPARHDVYELDLITGERTLKIKNPGTFDGWVADDDLNIRAALDTTSEGYSLVFYEDGEWVPHIQWTYDEQLSLGFYGFNRNGTLFYFRDALENDTAQLIEYDIATRSRRVVYTDPTHDVSSTFLYNDDTDSIQAVAIEKERLHWHVFDPAIQKAFETLKKANPGDPYISSRSLDRSKWVVGFHNDASSFKYYLYDADQDKIRLLFSCQPALDTYQLAPIKPISFVARDGLKIPGYLTVPVGVKSEKLPLVLYVHGGPCARDSWRYDPSVQWLANRGYAVLQVNYRGSTGYGKKFMTACYGEWGRKMHYDLLDAVQWAIDEGIADPDRVAIFGGSYGGYAALCGATISPDRFTCAVDFFGISNLLSFMENVPPYWELARPWFYHMVGDPEKDKDLLLDRSPLTHVNNIKIPILVVQGANDPRVKQSESEQIVAAMKEKGISHKYMLFDNEGHGFARPENRLAFYAAVEKFLTEHLGGRCES